MTDGIRTAIVCEAIAWLNTPFHHAARCKGCGVDCCNFLIGVYHAIGLVSDITLEAYPQDWHMHQVRARFLDELLKYADPLPPGDLPQPGDIAMFHYGLQAAHGAIVTVWPEVIHAWRDQGKVVLSDASNGPLAKRLAGFYRLRGLA